MALYSFQGEPPKPLPSRIRLDNGFTRSNSSTYTQKELEKWGYYGPISIPSPKSGEKLQWDGQQRKYVRIQLSQEEIEQSNLESSRQMVDYQSFYDNLLVNSAYQTVRHQAKQSLEVVVACTEFIAALGDAKAGRPNEAAIQACIANIKSVVNFSANELETLSDLMDSTGMSALYEL